MSELDLATQQIDMTCAICTKIYTSPRFLPCHHTFCLPCLETLAGKHGNVVRCPTCRAPAAVPAGGVRALQVNFYFSDDVLELARRNGGPNMCSFHIDKKIIFRCLQCDEAICKRCHSTTHQKHLMEHLSDVVARRKKTIEENLCRMESYIQNMVEKSEAFKRNQREAREKRVAASRQIQARYNVIVAMAEKYGSQAMKQLQEVSDELEKDLAAHTQGIQEDLNSLLRFQDRARRALSSECYTEVVQMEKEMTRGHGSDKQLKELEAVLPDTSYRPGLYGNFAIDIEDDIKKFIGSPVKLTVASQREISLVGVCQYDDKECREVQALRQKEDEIIEVCYGGPGGECSKATEVSMNPDGSINKKTEYETRTLYVTRKDYIIQWGNPFLRIFGSKSDSMFAIYQNIKTGCCDVRTVQFIYKEGNEVCRLDTSLIHPKVNKIQNFDSNKSGVLFAVVDDDDGELPTDDSAKKDEERENKGSRVVRLYSNKSDEPIATYTPPKQPFFPTDICFCGDNLLIIADWINDSVHVTKVTETDLRFIDYLPGAGGIVRPTALNLDLNGHLLIGCGDGWVLKYVADISQMGLFKSSVPCGTVAKVKKVRSTCCRLQTVNIIFYYLLLFFFVQFLYSNTVEQWTFSDE